MLTHVGVPCKRNEIFLCTKIKTAHGPPGPENTGFRPFLQAENPSDLPETTEYRPVNFLLCIFKGKTGGDFDVLGFHLFCEGGATVFHRR